MKKEKEFIIIWTEKRGVVVKAKDADDAIEKYHQNKIERKFEVVKNNFSVEELSFR